MKKLLRYGIFFTLIMVVGFMIVSSFIQLKDKRRIENQIESIPDFAFKSIDDDVFISNQGIKNNLPTLILYFNTECEHCLYEAEQISKNHDKFSASQVLMVSFENIDTLKHFAMEYGFYNQENISVLQDSKFQFDSIFGRSPVPSSFIYDINGKLVKKFFDYPLCVIIL